MPRKLVVRSSPDSDANKVSSPLRGYLESALRGFCRLFITDEINKSETRRAKTTSGLLFFVILIPYDLKSIYINN